MHRSSCDLCHDDPKPPAAPTADDDDDDKTIVMSASSPPLEDGERRRMISELSEQLDELVVTSSRCPIVLTSEGPEEELLIASTSSRHPLKDRSGQRLDLQLRESRSALADAALDIRSSYCDMESPISPSFAVPPPPVAGHRRLPPLPIGILSSAANIVKPLQEDHRLCFGMDSASQIMMSSGVEDSYYEDGLNGNRKGHAFQQEDSSGVSSCTASEHLNPSHRAQFAFVPRHDDEVLLEVGDPVYVDRECEDHWCYGTNLRTGQQGIFPSAHVFEVDIVEELCSGTMTLNLHSDERDTFYLTLLGSVEVAHHKGNEVLVQAINKVLKMYQNKEDIIVPQSILMEISFRGVHLIDKRRTHFFKCPIFDYFYSLQNISFCGAHPKQLRYFGFITKHPLLPRFACHVFMSTETTQPIVEAIGRAFKRSYDEYMAFAHPTEDIYID
uniref:JNK-interacting protein 1 n=1 Tax=Plectus sambesii TaxID=2011161 RepID=A0A914VWR7_9BILA